MILVHSQIPFPNMEMTDIIDVMSDIIDQMKLTQDPYMRYGLNIDDTRDLHTVYRHTMDKDRLRDLHMSINVSVNTFSPKFKRN